MERERERKREKEREKPARRSSSARSRPLPSLVGAPPSRQEPETPESEPSVELDTKSQGLRASPYACGSAKGSKRCRIENPGISIQEAVS